MRRGEYLNQLHYDSTLGLIVSGVVRDVTYPALLAYGEIRTSVPNEHWGTASSTNRRRGWIYMSNILITFSGVIHHGPGESER